MQKTSAILVSIVAAVVVVILVVIFLGDKLRRTPDHTIDADWETVKRGELERPPLKWSSTESDWLYLKRRLQQMDETATRPATRDARNVDGNN